MFWILLTIFVLLSLLLILALLRTSRGSDQGADRMFGRQSADR